MQQVCELVLIPSFSFTSDPLCASKCLSHLTSYFPVSLSAEQFTGHFCKQLRGILVRNVMGSYPTDATKRGGGCHGMNIGTTARSCVNILTSDIDVELVLAPLIRKGSLTFQHHT